MIDFPKLINNQHNNVKREKIVNEKWLDLPIYEELEV